MALNAVHPIVVQIRNYQLAFHEALPLTGGFTESQSELHVVGPHAL